MFQTMTQTRAHVTDAGLAAYMRQIFNYMTGGVAISGVVAWLTVNSPAMLNIATTGATQWIFFAIWMGFGFFMNKIIESLSPTAALGVFAAFSALTGFALAPLALIYTGASIATAFFTASAMFAGSSLYGYVSKKSLSSWGTFLNMACWGVLAAIVVNLVVGLVTGSGINGLSFIISLAIVPLMAGVTAYETNMLKDMYAQLGGDEVAQSKTAIYGAASLYMNFIVMFIHLLQLLGQNRD